MLIAAVAAMSIGWVLARVERSEVVTRDELPLTEFVGEVGRRVAGLEQNLDETLWELCRVLEPKMSERKMRALAETYAGVRQVSIVVGGRLGKENEFDETLDLGEASPFPLPRLRGRGGIDVGRLKSPDVSYFWARGAGGHAYFVSRQGQEAGRFVVLGVARDELVEVMNDWLRKWGEMSEGRPDTVYPISSRVGNWQLQSWHERKVVVEYREPVLVTSAVLALGLLLGGVVLFFTLRRSVKIAVQRVSFVNQVSHELRTPLTNMMLNLDLAQDAVGQSGVAARRLGFVGEELGRLQRLLENVLTFSNRDELRMARVGEELELRTEVRKALGVMEATMERQGVESELKLEDDLRVLGDGDALAQILGNLFSNVLKYGGGGGRLLLLGERDAQSVLLRVCDSGLGVRERDREKIFQPFFRLSDRVNEGVSGSGLGLAIARDLARAMKGDLRCVARPDGERGACFELVLPASEGGAEIVPFQSKAS